LSGTFGPLALIVLDGWEHQPEREGNAVALASKPHCDGLLAKYPHTLIEASGVRVGLLAGVVGNSNVGHLNMGSGRVVRTDVVRIDDSIRTGALLNNEVLTAAMDSAKRPYLRASRLYPLGDVRRDVE
jgi:2,3-bisphosphoglycerate-independent phosphoglycerate mutase